MYDVIEIAGGENKSCLHVMGLYRNIYKNCSLTFRFLVLCLSHLVKGIIPFSLIRGCIEFLQ